jgi:hypothetical protein
MDKSNSSNGASYFRDTSNSRETKNSKDPIKATSGQTSSKQEQSIDFLKTIFTVAQVSFLTYFYKFSLLNLFLNDFLRCHLSPKLPRKASASEKM